MKRSEQTILDQSAAPRESAAEETNRGVTPLVSRAVESLSGEAVPPGDKSISHRALIVSALLEQGERLVDALTEELWNQEKEERADESNHKGGTEVPFVADSHAGDAPEDVRPVGATVGEVVLGDAAASAHPGRGKG